MKFGVCGSLKALAALQNTGIDYVEEHLLNFLMPLKSEEDFAARKLEAEKSSLPIEAANCYLPGDLKCVGENVDIEALLSYSDTAFRRAQEIGIEIVVFGSGGSRRIPEGFAPERALEQFVGLLKQLGPLAEKRGITITVEPLHKAECNFITSLGEGAEIVEKCDHPNVALLADIYHMTKDGQGPEDIVRFGKHLRHLHIAEHEKRTAPGTMGDDFRPFFRALKQVSYDARISIEGRWDDLANQVASSIGVLKQQWEEA